MLNGGTESNPEWWFFLHRILKVCFEMFGDNFNIFSDEAASIANAVNKILPGFKNLYLCVKHKEGNVKKHFGVEAAKLFLGLCLAFTKEQYLEYHAKIVDLSETCKPRKYGKKLQAVNDTLYTYIFGKDGVSGKVKEELKYVRYQIMKNRIIRYGITATSAAESPNRYPGTGRSSFGRGYCRYLTPVYMVVGYLTWYYERMEYLFIEAIERNNNGKLVTKYAENIIKKRLKKLQLNEVKKPDSTTLNTMARGSKVNMETIVLESLDEDEQTKIKRHSKHTVDFRGKKCTCGMWQEMRIVCKHALFVIFYRCFNTFEIPKDINDIDLNKISTYMIEKKYIDEIYTMKQYLKMFKAMFPNHGDEKTEVVAPQVDLIVSEGNECSATRIPRAPQAGGKWTSSTAKKPGRKQEKRLIASGKTKKDL